MDNIRMSNADMLQYCDEALAWEDFGPIDIYFFESVKKILLGESSVKEEPEENGEFADIKRPVTSAELEPEYKNFPDFYYNNDDKSENNDVNECVSEQEAFSNSIFSKGFFVIAPEGKKYRTAKPLEKSEEKKDGNISFKVKI
ncbi:MAG: hypothetical protein K2I80_10015 [Ruminococcus sp.]|nr:hypothetical protein [Ruminococcus sp.]MDE6849365.1 hypothetical protein [Ruminococcus sp.]